MCVMVQDDGSLLMKLTDFGSCKTAQEPMKYVGLTPEYLAPEIAKLVIQTR